MSGSTGNLFGGLPVAWGKISPTDTFNIQAGKLPTLIGAEAAFTFQNMNIERGLLWAQEPIVSKGVQANLTTGPVAWALSVNDGYYSGDYNWLSGAATWTIDPVNTVVAQRRHGPRGPRHNRLPVGEEPARYRRLRRTTASMIEAAYTYNNAPWTITPYLQYSQTARRQGLCEAGSGVRLDDRRGDPCVQQVRSTTI